MKNLFLLLIPLFLWTCLSYGQRTTLRGNVNPPQKGIVASVASQAQSPTQVLQKTQRGDEQSQQSTPSKAPSAWISTWYFSQTPGIYTAITGGTPLGTTANDENVFGPFSIGFTFNYNGTAYTQFSVATNGFIGLGGTAVTTQTLPISTAAGSNNIISGLGLDLQGQTGSDLSYVMTGTAPSRVLTIQWKNYRRKSATADVINFQINLNEINNSITFIYGAFTIGANNSTAQIGLRGASSSEFNNRSVVTNISTTVPNPWGISTAGTVNTASNRVRTACYPGVGQTYGWTPLQTQTATLPIIENFDGVPIGTMPKGWAIENTNADAYMWMSTAELSNSGYNAMTIFYNSTLAMNDWFFSPQVALVAGHSYRVKCFYQNDGGTTYPEKMEIKYGPTATSAGMTSAAIFSNTAITGSYQLGSGIFVPASTGNFYIGFHGFSAADEDVLLVDDITIEEVFNDDVGSIALINPTKIPGSQLFPWSGKVLNSGFNTETFPVNTKMRENSVLSNTATNTISSLAANASATLSGNFTISTLGPTSTFDLSLETNLSGDQNASNNILTNYTRACTKDSTYSWDDGTSEGTIGFDTGLGWLGQMYFLSTQDTLTSITVKWGTIPGALTGTSFEIYNVAGGLPTTKFADIVTGLSLTTTEQGILKTYKPSSPIILPPGTYWIGAHQSVALAGTYLISTDGTGFNATNFLPGYAMYSGTGTTWSDYTASGLYVFNLIRPNFANIIVPFVSNPSVLTATPVSTSEIDLSWVLNSDNNNVLLAFNTTNSFGTPVSGTIYSAGNSIPGGGTVLQYNNMTSYNHLGLSANTTYYYKAWSYNGSIYSGGLTTSAVTPCSETPSPWSEDFEASTFPPSCWDVNSISPTWIRSTAASANGVGTASAEANFYNISSTEPSFALFTLPFNQGSLAAPNLSFDYAYATYSGEVDELDIYYSVDAGANFLPLLAMPGGTSGILNTGGVVGNNVEFVPTAAQWANKVIALPAGTNMIAFNAISAYGNNLYIDNIKIIEGLLHDVGISALESREVYPFGTVTPMALVNNYGGSSETFPVTMTIGSYSSTKTVTIGAGLNQIVTFDPWTNVVGDYNLQVCTQLATDLSTGNDCMSHAIKVIKMDKEVYGYNAYPGYGTDPEGPTSFNLANPQILNSLADQGTQNFVTGGTWANGHWYGIVANSTATPPYYFITLDPVTGARTVIGDMGMSMSGLSYNTATNTMYAVDATSLYTIDMTTGLPTLVGANTDISLVNLAINNAGIAYAVDATGNNLGTIDLSTGVFTVVGPVGFDVQYAQDMEFDRESGDLFMAAQDATSGWLAWVNQATGATMVVNDFEGGAEITSFAIPYTSATFNVDMSTAEGFVPGTDLVYLTGSFAGWAQPGTTGSILMSRIGTSMIYTATFPLPVGTYEYKYFKNAGWANGEWNGGSNRSITLSATSSFDDTWGGAISWANLQWPGTGTVLPGTSFDVYAQVYLPNGITTNAGATYGLQAWIGYSTSNTDPSTWTNWIPATFNSQSADNDEYKADLGAALSTAGTYYYASRFRFGNENYVYGGFNTGFWDGTTNVSGVLNLAAPTKTLNVKLFLESLYNTGTGSMNQALGLLGPQFGAGIAEEISIELHDSSDPYATAYTFSNLSLLTNGNVIINTLPGSLTGPYYIVVKNRNSLETWSASPISLGGAGPFSYDFSTGVSQAYGDNLRLSGTVYVIYGGDATQDGVVDGSDMAEIDNASTSILIGYVTQDVNGDGVVDGSDMALIDNNATAIVNVKRP